MDDSLESTVLIALVQCDNIEKGEECQIEYPSLYSWDFQRGS